MIVPPLAETNTSPVFPFAGRSLGSGCIGHAYVITTTTNPSHSLTLTNAVDALSVWETITEEKEKIKINPYLGLFSLLFPLDKKVLFSKGLC